LIVGRLHLEHDEGPTFDLGVSTVRYVFATHKTEAKTKSIRKFLDKEGFGGKISDVKMEVDRVEETKFWALLSWQAYWAWHLDQPDQQKLKTTAVETALKWHKYIK